MIPSKGLAKLRAAAKKSAASKKQGINVGKVKSNIAKSGNMLAGAKAIGGGSRGNPSSKKLPGYGGRMPSVPKTRKAAPKRNIATAVGGLAKSLYNKKKAVSGVRKVKRPSRGRAVGSAIARGGFGIR